MTVDSKRISEFLWAHQLEDGGWMLHDTFKDEFSHQTYPTVSAARAAYDRGEPTWTPRR